MNILQIISTLLFFGWMFFTAYLLWVHAVRSGKRQDKTNHTLIESSANSANAALKAADASQKLAEAMIKLTENKETVRHHDT